MYQFFTHLFPVIVLAIYCGDALWRKKSNKVDLYKKATPLFEYNDVALSVFFTVVLIDSII